MSKAMVPRVVIPPCTKPLVSTTTCPYGDQSS